jgi:hypothetical protein
MFSYSAHHTFALFSFVSLLVFRIRLTYFISLKTTTIIIIIMLPQVSEILSRFERKGYKLVAIKLIVPSKEFTEKHYHDLKERPFFNGLCDFLSSGPVLAMVSRSLVSVEVVPASGVNHMWVGCICM